MEDAAYKKRPHIPKSITVTMTQKKTPVFLCITFTIALTLNNRKQKTETK